MLILKCIGTAILGGIIGGLVVLIPACVIWVIANIFGPEEIANTIATVITCLGIFVGIIVGFMIPIWDKGERRRQEIARLQRVLVRLLRHKEEQEEYRKQMIVVGEQSLGFFELLAKHLDSAEKFLDQAEVDFAEDAFAPFWDSIENATKCLAYFDEGVRSLKDNLSRYTELIRKYEDTPPQFPLTNWSVARLGVGTTTAERMKAIVRTAQRSFQFAMIYEQRKTNQILIAGFTNLARALEEMTQRITASIEDLADSVNVMTSTLDASMRAIESQLGEIQAEIVDIASEAAAREERALEILDNIQRRRKP